MFTRQIERMQELRGGDVSAQVIDLLSSLLGNCQQPLEHRAPVTISVQNPAAPVSYFDDLTAFSAILAENPIGVIDTDPERNRFGWAGFFRGPVNIRPNNINGIGLVIVGGAHFNNLFIDNIYNHDGTPYRPLITQYARAQRNWEKNSGNPRVLVRLLDAWGGSETGTSFYVYIRQQFPDGTKHSDPNVIVGQDISFFYDSESTPVTTDPGAWDDKIGMVKLWHKIYDDSEDSIGKFDSNKTYSGWGLMDGVHNSGANGGSGIDMQDFFARGQIGTDACNNTERGTDRHNHNISLDGSETGIKVYDPDNSGDLSSDFPAHRAHVHRIGTHCGVQDFTSTSTELAGYLITELADEHTATGPFYSSTEKESEVDHSSAHDDITLRHGVNDPGHSHLGEAFENLHLPPYKYLHFIERVDNSFEQLGV